MKHPEITFPFWILTLPVKMVLCQLTYTTNRQINISTCPHRVVILNIVPKVFRTAKLSASNASAPMNKLQKRLRELKYHLKKRGYNNASINHCFWKASGIERKEDEEQSAICHNIPSCAQ
jgi:hypothetical protein